MAATTSTASDLLTGGLRNLGVLAAGEAIAASDAADSLQVMNDMLDSLSTDQLFIPYSVENILAWTPGQYQYTIGNPVGGTFIGTTTVGSYVITGITPIPSNLILGGTLTAYQNEIPASTTITIIGANTITMSAPATASVTADQITFTVPGNFGIQRPLRVRPSFTRITASGNIGLDYWFPVGSIADYNEIGYKGVSGPWPTRAAYQTAYPYGSLRVYPNPSQAGELHLWTDVVLSNFTTMNQQISLPQGYARAIKKLLALELAPEYGRTPSPELLRQAAEARSFIRSMNEAPVKMLDYDSALRPANSWNDASWIMDGGFNR